MRTTPTPGARLLVFAVSCLAAVFAAPGAPAQRAINGGPALTSPSQAPWSVLLDMSSGTKVVLSCSGSILDATHVLTAAHCTFDDTGQPFPASAYQVTAGLVELDSGGDFSQEQQRQVSSVLVHPGYASGQVSDDVAVLVLSSPLKFGGAAVAPIGLVPPGTPPASGTSATVAGWGQVQSGQVDQYEHSLGETVLPAFTCEDGVPSILCVSTPSGALCPGDSGSGLVATLPQPVLVGVADRTAGCTPGAPATFADLASPEVGSWVRGDLTPPRAPTTSAPASILGYPYPGGVLTCTSPVWTGSPAVTFDFVDIDTNTVLQEGSKTYVPDRQAVGRHVACTAVARNDGGTAYSGLSGSYRIRPQLDPKLTVHIDSQGFVDVFDTASVPLQLHARLTAASGHLVETLTFSDRGKARNVGSLRPGRYDVCVDSDSRSIYAPSHVCFRWIHYGDAVDLIKEGAIVLRRGGRYLTLRSKPALAGKEIRITWEGKRCETCPHYLLSTSKLRLGRVSYVALPVVHGRQTVDLIVRIPRVEVGGGVYRAGVLRLTYVAR